MQSAADLAIKPRPDHIPAHLVRDYPFVGCVTTQDEPWKQVPEIHKGPPVIWADNAHMNEGAWVPRRYEDLQQLYTDTVNFTPRGMAPFSIMAGQSWYLVPQEAVAPLHMRFRLMLNPMLAPAAIAKLETRIRGYAREQIAVLGQGSGCDLLKDFALEFPIRVFLELMGLPQEERAQFLIWEEAILRSNDAAIIGQATREIVAYLEEECEKRRVEPRNDLLTLGVQAEVGGNPLTREELIGFCFNMFVGGLDTVSTSMSNQLLHLARHPEHQAFLRANPDRIGDAVDEMMRAYGAVTTSRRCLSEITIGGVDMKPGDSVLLPSILSSNDPEIFPNPEIVDFDRKPRHLSFGYGPHVCVGNHLARREMRIAIEEMLAGLPTFHLAPNADLFWHIPGSIGPGSVPIVW